MEPPLRFWNAVPAGARNHWIQETVFIQPTASSGADMGKQALEASLAEGGTHHRLARMAGEWTGHYKLWFEPGKLAGEAPQHGTIRGILGGRFLLHEYEGSFDGEPFAGVALYGHHIDDGSWESAWVDSFHTGTAIMFSTAPASDGCFAALGSYGDGQGGRRWGWRTEIEQPDDDTLVITMFNITPDGDEGKAVETRYQRVR
jgi:hypothetical protein